jgi:mannose-6-phosphate isomerase-like protein (cupin superfamily)
MSPGEADRVRVRSQEPEASPAALYERILRQMDDFQRRQREVPLVVHDADVPWEVNRQGRIKYHINAMSGRETALDDWWVFSQDLRDRSGRHTHQGGIAIFVVEGRGYTVIDGERFDWQAGDLVVLPLRPGGVEHQHFNTGEAPARWVAFCYIPYFKHVASEMTQQATGSAWESETR